MIRYSILFSVLIVALFNSCKRFEEDPITLRTPENRIRRYWYMQSFTVDGKDSMAFAVRNKLTGAWDFGVSKSSSGSYFDIKGGYSGLYNMYKKDELLKVGPIRVDGWIQVLYTFKIIKLTSKELKIQDPDIGLIIYFRSTE